MGAPVASGTLAGSRSGSWASIHKEPARGGFPRFRRQPPVHTTRTILSTLAEWDIVVRHDFRYREKQQLEIGVTSGARFVSQGDLTPRARGRLSAAAGCTQPTIRVIAGGHGHAVDAAIAIVA